MDDEGVDGVETTIVCAVLLADGWHEIQQGSFRVGEPADGWHDDMTPIALEDRPVPMFTYLEETDGAPMRVKGALSSILAVKERVYD
ncbi:hypothetical protein GCM10023191_022850 [Actinoallomurus oryzae]|uniref:Uncharacterized protein n=1 Tax=Actinoallomurus oryzae TaxID=502180 RepID=A0ABP8PSG0_9ACTN